MSNRLDKLDQLTVAHLFATGVAQVKIAAMLGIDDSKVGTLLKHGRADEWLRETVELTPPLSPEEKSRVDARITSESLRSLLHEVARQTGVSPVSTVRVYPTPDSKSDDPREQWDSRLADFGRTARGHVLDLLRGARIAGIAWGSTPRAIVDGIRAGGSSLLPRRHPVTFLPLCGEPLGAGLSDTSASALAVELARAVNGNPRHAVTLENVPALIPISFSPEEIAVVKKLLSHIEVYVRTYGESDTAHASNDRYLDRMDTIVTSVSPGGQPWGSRGGALLSSARLQVQDLERVCVGDIAGVLLPSRSPDAAPAVERLMRNWTGVQLADLERVAHSADRDHGGIIVVAIGANKAPVILEVIRRGLCTHLLVDQDLVNALTALAFGNSQ